MTTILARYGAIPEVVRCSMTDGMPASRGETVVIRTSRGTELAEVLEIVHPSPEPGVAPPPATSELLRKATPADLQTAERLRRQAQTAFPRWEQRIREWGLDLQLIDLEWLLDESKVVLYVLNERGPECTKLALQAAAAGLGIIDVQPVSADGLVTQPNGGGGCGSCGAH